MSENFTYKRIPNMSWPFVNKKYPNLNKRDVIQINNQSNNYLDAEIRVNGYLLTFVFVKGNSSKRVYLKDIAPEAIITVHEITEEVDLSLELNRSYHYPEDYFFDWKKTKAGKSS